MKQCTIYENADELLDAMTRIAPPVCTGQIVFGDNDKVWLACCEDRLASNVTATDVLQAIAKRLGIANGAIAIQHIHPTAKLPSVRPVPGTRWPPDGSVWCESPGRDFKAMQSY